MASGDTSPSQQRTIADIGEKGLLDIIGPYLAKSNDKLWIGPGDDAAVVSPKAFHNEALILTTDMLVEGTHFPSRPNFNWRQLGIKAFAANLSDIAAMGGIPCYALVSLGLPPEILVNEVVALYEGLHEMSHLYGVAIVGGDTVHSPVVTLSITLTGKMQEGISPALRQACRPGQTVYLTGTIGGSRAGLTLSLNPDLRAQLDASTWRVLLDCHWAPQPRVELGAVLTAICPDIAMIDVSDSLWHELNMLADASGCGFDISLDRIPFPPELVELCNLTKERLQDYILFSGEEYELLFCTRLEPEMLLGRLREHGISGPITAIGKVTENKKTVRIFDASGQVINVSDNTFRHF